MLHIPELIDRGADAFTDSIVMTCFIGGIIILVAAGIVWALIPKGMKITDNNDPAETPQPAELAPVETFVPPALTTETAVDDGSVHISVDAATMRDMEAVCRNLGITPNIAFAMFAKKVANERQIPFTLAADPLYNDGNLAHIQRGIRALDEGRGIMHECDDIIRVWTPEAWSDYTELRTHDPETYAHIKTLIRDIEQNGDSGGDGNPRQLKGNLSQLWTRDINEQSKLIYRAVEGELQIVSCKYHFSD